MGSQEGGEGRAVRRDGREGEGGAGEREGRGGWGRKEGGLQARSQRTTLPP